MNPKEKDAQVIQVFVIYQWLYHYRVMNGGHVHCYVEKNFLDNQLSPRPLEAIRTPVTLVHGFFYNRNPPYVSDTIPSSVDG